MVVYKGLYMKNIIMFFVLIIFAISVNLYAYNHEEIAEDIFNSLGMEEWYYEFTYTEDGETYYFEDILQIYSYVLSDPNMTRNDYESMSQILNELMNYITSQYTTDQFRKEPYSTYLMTFTLMVVYLEVRVNIVNNYNNTKDIVNFLMFDYATIVQSIPNTWRNNRFCSHVDKQLNIIFANYAQYGSLKSIDFEFWNVEN